MLLPLPGVQCLPYFATSSKEPSLSTLARVDSLKHPFRLFVWRTHLPARLGAVREAGLSGHCISFRPGTSLAPSLYCLGITPESSVFPHKNLPFLIRDTHLSIIHI